MDQFPQFEELCQVNEDVVEINTDLGTNISATLKVEGGNVMAGGGSKNTDDYYQDLKSQPKNPDIAMEFTDYYNALNTQVASKVFHLQSVTKILINFPVSLINISFRSEITRTVSENSWLLHKPNAVPRKR